MVEIKRASAGRHRRASRKVAHAVRRFCDILDLALGSCWFDPRHGTKATSFSAGPLHFPEAHLDLQQEPAGKSFRRWSMLWPFQGQRNGNLRAAQGTEIPN